MDKLEPCPFCGETKLEMWQTPVWFSVVCQDVNCGAEGPIGFSTAEAIEKWNKRADKSNLEDLLIREFPSVNDGESSMDSISVA